MRSTSSCRRPASAAPCVPTSFNCARRRCPSRGQLDSGVRSHHGLLAARSPGWPARLLAPVFAVTTEVGSFAFLVPLVVVMLGGLGACLGAILRTSLRHGAQLRAVLHRRGRGPDRSSSWIVAIVYSCSDQEGSLAKPWATSLSRRLGRSPRSGAGLWRKWGTAAFRHRPRPPAAGRDAISTTCTSSLPWSSSTAVLAMTFILTLRTGLINLSMGAFWGVGAHLHGPP